MAADWGITGSARIDRQQLFTGLELTLEPGWTCLMGPSGAGKSTLLRLLAGLETSATFEGTIRRPDRIGWMGQTDLMQRRLTVAQNVTLMARLAARPHDPVRTESILRSVGLAGFGPRRPETLSGGQRQRVALARTLIEGAPLILLDEPFSALDPANRAAMQELAHAQLAGRTVLLVTHDPAEALLLGTRLFMLAQGGLATVPALAPPHPRDSGDPELAQAAG